MTARFARAGVASGIGLLVGVVDVTEITGGVDEVTGGVDEVTGGVEEPEIGVLDSMGVPGVPGLDTFRGTTFTNAGLGKISLARGRCLAGLGVAGTLALSGSAIVGSAGGLDSGVFALDITASLVEGLAFFGLTGI